MALDAITVAIPLGSAILGFIGGVLSEPLKKRLVYRYERNRLRDSLYSELATNVQYMIFYTLRQRSERDMSDIGPLPDLQKWLRKDVYLHALDKEPVLYHEIRESAFISQCYLAITIVEEPRTTEQRLNVFENMQKMIYECARRGQLSRRRLAGKSTMFSTPFEHPLRTWARRMYYKIEMRNAPKDGRPHLYAPSETLKKKIVALWRGCPQEVPYPQVNSHEQKKPQ
jgi:hypothetical protein